MRIFTLTACALLFTLPCKADKFWLSDPAASKNAPTDSSPDCIEGVLIAEDADGYHIRIVGGELLLAKKGVFKVEKDALTLDAIVKAEQDGAEALAAANKERGLQQQIAKKEREIKVAEAAAKKGGQPVDGTFRKTAAPAEASFDAVVDALPAVMSRGDLLRETQLAYELTKDRSYLRALRQLRRLR